MCICVAPLFSLFLQSSQLGYIAKGKLCPNSPIFSKQEIDLKSFWFDTGTISRHSLTTVVQVHPLCHELLLKYIVKKYTSSSPYKISLLPICCQNSTHLEANHAFWQILGLYFLLPKSSLMNYFSAARVRDFELFWSDYLFFKPKLLLQDDINWQLYLYGLPT